MNQKRPGNGQDETPLARRARVASQIGTGLMVPSMLLLGMIGGYFLGAWIQGRWGGEPWWSIGGVILGGVASVRKIIELLRYPGPPDES